MALSDQLRLISQRVLPLLSKSYAHLQLSILITRTLQVVSVNANCVGTSSHCATTCSCIHVLIHSCAAFWLRTLPMGMTHVQTEMSMVTVLFARNPPKVFCGLGILLAASGIWNPSNSYQLSLTAPESCNLAVEYDPTLRAVA